MVIYFKALCIVFAFMAGTMGCSPIYDYVAKGKGSPSEKTAVYSDENGVRISLSGLQYYLNTSPKSHEFIVRIFSGEVPEKIVMLPQTVEVELFHKGKSVLGLNQEKIIRVFSSSHVCGKNKYPDKVREFGLPREMEVPGRCHFALNFRYFMRVHSPPDELEARVEFEYRAGADKVKVSESIKLFLDRKTFLWVYAT